MVDLSIEGNMLSLKVEGLDRLWALKSHLEIPLAHIKGVHRDPQGLYNMNWKTIKAPGTLVPGVIAAGTFYQQGKRVFWDVHNPENVIVIELHDERYEALVIEVADPDRAISLIADATK
jgi:hypothetical protein